MGVLILIVVLLGYPIKNNLKVNFIKNIPKERSFPN
jgi:hypothetical protein